MPQSFAQLHIHLVFSTKNREPILNEKIRDPLHAYIYTVLNNHKCISISINSVKDHLHILFDLSRTLSISKIVEITKTSSSKWIKTQGNQFTNFAWQSGYGAFSVSQSNVESVKVYIKNQAEHHKRISFQDEILRLLELHQIEYDEQYLWD